MRTRFPHAILLQGRAGIGKLTLAEALAASLLCEAPQSDGLACGQCLSCGWLAQGSHPDFRVITPEDRAEEGLEEVETVSKGKKKSHIVVDQIRGLSELVGLTAHRQGSRVVLLHPAETLNLAAANALLKMLEEPPPDTIFVLVSHQPQRLLPTIRSRCHKTTIPLPKLEDAQTWLKLLGIVDPVFSLAQAGGAPILAMEASEASTRADTEAFAQELAKAEKTDVFAISAHWGKTGLLMAIGLLQKWIYDVLSAKLYGVVRYYPKQFSIIRNLADRADIRLLLELQRALDKARGQASHPLNAELQLEALMLRYTQIF